MKRTSSGECAEKNHYVKFSWETLNLPCEYDDCGLVFDSLSYFMQHLNTHIQALLHLGEPVTCKWKNCDAEIPSVAEMQRHILFHAHHSKLKCYGRNFMTRKNASISCKIDNSCVNFVPELPNQFFCAWEDCTDRFENAEIFYRHVDFHAEDNPRGNKPSVKIPCRWSGCSTTVTSLYKLKEHLRTHTQEKVLACPNCGGMFASRTKFYDHMVRQTKPIQVKNKPPLSYQCGYCYKKFSSERLLRDHTRAHVNQYKCPYCDMTTPTPSGLRTHILYRHSEEKPFPCDICNYRAKNQSDLRKHLISHNSDQLLCCPSDECSYYTQSASALCHHIKNCHTDEGSSYQCHICAATFRRGYYLTRHLLKKHHLKWPSGHCRFRYQRGKDNVYRLQTVRYEWYDMSEVVLNRDEFSESSNNEVDDPVHCEKVQVLDTSAVCNVDYSITTNGAEVSVLSEEIPVMMIGGDDDLEKATANTLLSLAHAIDDVYLLGNNDSDIVKVNIADPGIDKDNVSGGNRMISLVKSNQDGSTVVEMAEVIAEG